MSLVFDNPVQPALALPPDLVLWQQWESVAQPDGRWRSYLHQLASTVLTSWFQEESGQSVHVWPPPSPSDLWQVVDGLALMLGQRRVVVILSEALDAATLRVPQEWVDIPGWTAHYYIAAYVDIDDERLVLWGYGSHAQVKTQGTYDAGDRTYSLSDADLIQDFSAFWVAQQLEQPQILPTPAFAPVSDTQAEHLIERLAAAVEPRLDIPFELWGALMSKARWRQQLGQWRRGITPVDLSRWLGQRFEPDWRSLEALLPQAAALQFRSETLRDATISRGKCIQFAGRREQVVLVLRVAPVIGEGDGSALDDSLGDRRSIRIQLFPFEADLLPSTIQMILESSETAEPLQMVQAGDHDNYIQIPRFRCPSGQQFRVIVQLADAMIREHFIT